MAEQFKHLFTPLKIGKMTVENRIASTPHISGLAEPNWLPGPRQLAYWDRKAQGGTGLIGTQAYPVHRTGFAGAPVAFDNEEFIPRWKNVVETLHRHGTKVTMQIWHGGRNTNGGATGRATWAPSATAVFPEYEIPHVMTEDEIWETINAYAAACVKAREAGLDGVELHFGHGYLLQQFNSPLTNQRTDDWGGSWEKRLRFGLEVIKASRAAVGDDFTMGMRISGDEFTDGGYTIDDMVTHIAPVLAGTGKIDFMSITYGTYAVWSVLIPSMYWPLGFAVYLAAAVKKVVDIPVFCVGRINDPVQAEKILADNQADIVGMTRAGIADPDFPKKAKEGRLEDIVKCIACNEGCIGRVGRGGMSCARTLIIGREREWDQLPPLTVKKKVVVVGGGVAGCETAKVAAERGHQVILVEKDSELGGQTNIAAKAPSRQDFAEIGRYYTYKLPTLGVEVMLNTPATADMILSMNPDAVVVATGSRPHKPKLPGIDQPNVVNVRDVLNEKVQVGEKALVVALEHHTIAVTCADFLATKGKKVEIINADTDIGRLMNNPTKLAVHGRLAAARVKLTPSTGLRKVEGNTATVYNVFSGYEETREVDTVVIAHEGEADDSLGRALKGKVKELHVIGQALSPRRLWECTFDGAELGRAL